MSNNNNNNNNNNNSNNNNNNNNNNEYATSWHVTAKTIYSPSQVERATEEWFLKFQFFTQPFQDNINQYLDIVYLSSKDWKCITKCK